MEKDVSKSQGNDLTSLCERVWCNVTVGSYTYIVCNLYRLGEKLVFFGPCSQWGRKPVSERGWAYFTVFKRIAHLSRPGVRVRDEHYSLLLPHFFSYFLSKYLCVSSAQLRTLTDPVHGWGLKDIPGGQLSELWWQTNLYSIGACAMFVFHMLAYPEFSALTHLTSLEISIPKTPYITTNRCLLKLACDQY